MSSKERGGCANKLTLLRTVKFSRKIINRKENTASKHLKHLIFMCFYLHLLSWPVSWKQLQFPSNNEEKWWDSGSHFVWRLKGA